MTRFVHYIGTAAAAGSLGGRRPDPDALLDGTVESLVPLWWWILSQLTGADARGATAPGSMPRDMWPSWAR